MAEQWLKALRAADTFLCQIQRLDCARSAEEKQVLQLCNHFQKLKLIDCEDSSLLTQAVNATVHFAQESRDKLLQCIVEGMDKFDKEPSQSAANESDDDQTWGAWEPMPTKEEEDTVPSRAGAWLDYEWKGIPNSKRQRWAAERGGWRKKRGGSSQSFFCAKFHKDHGQSHSWYFRNG